MTSGNGDAGALASISFLQNPGRNLNSYRSTISRDLNRFENISEIQTDAILSKFWPRCEKSVRRAVFFGSTQTKGRRKV